MWPRKQLDLGAIDLAYGFSQIALAHARSSAAGVVGEVWMPADEAIVALSVRTAWDLLLTALDLPCGSEVVMTAITIPDMVRIIEHHGLAPVAADVDPERLAPNVERLEHLITPRTRVILVAHLFGSRVEIGPIIQLARRYNLLVVEDCAQAYVGREYMGHPGSDCILFSFGPIKTMTALGGAVVRVRDEGLRLQMATLQRSYPVQSRVTYLKRLLKYATFWLLAQPIVYGWLVRGMQWCGVDYDRALGNAAHSFRSNELFTQIRRQPCVPLVRMLGWRIKRFGARGESKLRRRTTRGEDLSRSLPAGMVVGGRNPTHTYWVLPVRVANPEQVAAALRDAGFDATTRSSLIVVRSEARSLVADWLSEIVFLPSDESMPDSEWRRMLAVLQQSACVVEQPAGRELAALSSVSGAS